MTSPPFSLPDNYQGLAKIEGSAHFDGGTVWLEFQTIDSLIGLFKGAVMRVPLPIEHLETVGLEHRRFRSHLSLRVRSMEEVDEVPGSRGAEARLRFSRRYRTEVDEFYSALAEAISETESGRLGPGASRLETGPGSAPRLHR